MKSPEVRNLQERIGRIEKNLVSQLSGLQAALEELATLRQIFQSDGEQARKDAPLEPLIDAPEAARLLGLTKARIYVLASSGRLPGRKVGKYWKFTPGELKNFLDREISS